jgi:hypothetical protein
MPADAIENAPPATAPEKSVVQPKARDPLDPLGWELPVICKDCDKEFRVPYRHFQAGVVFHCPHCHGSYVPTLPMYHRVHNTFEAFFGRMRRERDKLIAPGAAEVDFSDRFQAQLAEFHKTLERLARELRPAGKMVRRKGLAAMFT